jgi:hypothetical protein
MSNRGVYANLADLKLALGITDTARDAQLWRVMEQASRAIDGICGRQFLVTLETRYYTARHACELFVPDLLVVTTLKTDDDNDRDYDYTWTENTDFELEPANYWPKWIIRTLPTGRYAFPCTQRGVQIIGQWGYGAGDGATPYTDSGATVTLTTATVVTGTASSGTPFAAGQTLLINSEQVFITAVSATTLTVERAVNGTTGAIHTAQPAYIYRYPAPVASACLLLAGRMFHRPGAPFGITGSAEMGMMRVNPRDPDIMQPLEPYMLVAVP